MLKKSFCFFSEETEKETSIFRETLLSGAVTRLPTNENNAYEKK